MMKCSQFWREASCALEAGVLDKFFKMDYMTRALIVATVETKQSLSSAVDHVSSMKVD
jgi:hypothetical protein